MVLCECTISSVEYDILESCLKDKDFRVRLCNNNKKDPDDAAKEVLGFILKILDSDIDMIELIDKENQKIRYSIKKQVAEIY